jgi:sugar O-acyltransferase (sialic acid O-acetyltransferase NeuD family)
MKKVAVIGFSGHALVAIEALQLSGHTIIGYVEKHRINNSKLNTVYLGFEEDPSVLEKLRNSLFFPAIGHNQIRSKVTEFLLSKNISITTAIHPKANISNSAIIGPGTLVCQGACINPFSEIKSGVIINTGAIIEHECIINNYAHIAPGAVLAGNVVVGKMSFVGANSIIKQGVVIGDNVTIGAGSIILKNVPDNETWFGNPAKFNKSNDRL